MINAMKVKLFTANRHVVMAMKKPMLIDTAQAAV